MTPREISLEGLAGRVAALPGVEAVRSAAERLGLATYLVGGSVRDLLLDRERFDVDVAVEGDPATLARELGGAARSHPRFGTATVVIDGHELDLATARTETYARPGALPDVRPAGLGDDLARRDFTVNALAIPLRGEAAVIDPHRGLADLAANLLRVLHQRSFVDDPTRALRAGRYAARLDFEVEPETLALLGEADLTTVSADRVEAELHKLAAEPAARRGFELLDDWGLVPLPPGAAELIERVRALTDGGRWRGLVEFGAAVLAATRPVGERVGALASATPASPSAAVEIARGVPALELLLARAQGAEWVDRYVDEWRHVRLEISGRELLEAGIPEGRAIGRGLEAALRAKLDGEAGEREAELRIALAAATSLPDDEVA